MKRYFLITLTDGRTFERDLNLIPGLPIGIRSTDPTLVQIAMSFAREGIIEDKQAKNLRIIAPSQIASVEIIFEEGNNLKVS